MSEFVSRDEQRRMGLLPDRQQHPANFLPAVQRPPNMPAQTGHHLTLDLTPNATQHVELRTSAVDRAKGHALSTSILGIVLGVLAVLGLWALRGEPYLSFWLFIVFWLTFAAVWAGSWFWAQLVSPEGVSLFEAWRKWNVVEREQSERWQYYRWQQGRELPAQKDIRYAVLLGLAVGLPVALAILWGWK